MGGNSFKKDGLYILEEQGRKLSILPSVQHGELSVCDNHFNAIVKERRWAKCEDGQDEAYEALLLLKETDMVDPDAIHRMFVDNFVVCFFPLREPFLLWRCC